jgi:aminoglycoside phosphotransferase (APT) family kinase protein
MRRVTGLRISWSLLNKFCSRKLAAARSIGDDEKLRNRIAERAACYFPDYAGRVEVQISRKAQRAYSQIYQLEICHERHKARRLVVKVTANARREYEQLKTLWEEFSVHSTFGVARPLDYLDEGPAFVMEAIGGVSLQTLFPRWYWRAKGVERAQSACHLAGRWLRLYHKISTTDPVVSVDVVTKVADFRRTWKELVAVGFNQRTGEKISSLLNTLADDLAAKSFARVRVHGDFSIDNVWLDQGRVVVLDISGAHRNVPELDIAAFLNSLLLLRFGGWISLRTFRLLRAAFLGGYGDERTISPVAVNFFQATGVVDVLWELWQRRPRWITRALSQPVLTGVAGILEHERIA